VGEIMLLYHPAYDIFHGMFRFLRIFRKVGEKPLETDRVKILDFYLLFPELLQSFRFPKELIRLKHSVRRPENPYRTISDPKRVFFRLSPYQDCSLRSLVAHGFIREELLGEGIIERTERSWPTDLLTAVDRANGASPELIDLLTGPLLRIDLYGESGLKGRSDLFEYRYDPVKTPTNA
jgi:hypothetical protein